MHDSGKATELRPELPGTARVWIAIACMMLVASLPCARASAAPTEKLSDFVHRFWQDKDGLPENNVLAIAQTADGYLWVATEEGLARFDGVQFTVFSKRNTPAIKNNVVTSLVADGADESLRELGGRLEVKV